MPTEIGSLIFYPVEELAEKFGWSPAMIYGYIRAGSLRGKRFGKQYQIAQSHIEDFLMGGNDGAA